MAAARAPWDVIVPLAFEAIGMVAVATWAVRQIRAVARDLAATRRYHRSRDALARAVRSPRVVP